MGIGQLVKSQMVLIDFWLNYVVECTLDRNVICYCYYVFMDGNVICNTCFIHLWYKH